ncbi:MAG: hypothetical protein GVY28_06865 [Alphaproteobacteria bacterium]|jgi:hypothetical protein|nr:hypothetical protein [Alphaproteobacteria bacterium]
MPHPAARGPEMSKMPGSFCPARQALPPPGKKVAVARPSRGGAKHCGRTPQNLKAARMSILNRQLSAEIRDG